MPRQKRFRTMIDPPTPYDTMETWERHLSDLKSLPADEALKPDMIKHANEMIARKKAEEGEITGRVV